jgi:spermidine synthase
VSGVSSLFSVEFYRLARRHLEPDGILVQWLQLYEFRVDLLASVMRALGEVFPDYVIYAADDNDILVVAGAPEVLARPLADLFDQPGLAHALKSVQVTTMGDLDIRRVGARRALHPLFESYPVPPNSDFYPYLDLNAARQRFLQADASDFLALAGEHAPLVALIDPPPPSRESALEGAAYFRKMESMRRARYARDFLLERAPEPINIPRALQRDLELVQVRLIECASPAAHDGWLHALYQVAHATLPYLAPRDGRELWRRLSNPACDDVLAPAQQRWLALFESVAQRDVITIAALGEALLGEPGAALDSPATRRYLLGLTMAAYVALGEQARARALWTRTGQPFARDMDLELRLAHAHAFDGLARPR